MPMTYSPFMDPGDAFAQLGRIRPRETSLHDVFQRVVDLAGLSIHGVTEVSVTMVRDRGAHTPASTGGLASTLDELQYELGYGPCLQAANSTTVESVVDMAAETRWPDWTTGALRAGARSSLSIGLPGHATVGGALNFYATEPHVFDDDAIIVAQAFAGFAGVAMANEFLNEAQATLLRRVEAAMDRGAVIEQAKGVLINERRCTPAQAFTILTTMAQDTDRTVRAVAQEMVNRTAEGPPG
jgi:GAF domain-containing protein